MDNRHSDRPHQQRRRLLRTAGSALLASPALSLLGCAGRPADGSKAGTATTGNGDAAWASGGTAKIGDPARFPNPFSNDLSQACVLTCMTTIGPCHTVSPERVDVSDGWEGIPLRLALRVVDAECKPAEGAVVEIWHTNHTGGYSGQIARMCNNDQDDLDKQFFRGYQRSDANGVVNFDTCYPGWYRGRAVHIHLRVLTGDYDADDRAVSSVTTQLLFSDEQNADIFANHPIYSKFGQPDTTLDTDNVVGGEEDKSPYLFDVRRMGDGVMFASKTLVIRKSQEEPVCEAKGAWGRGPGERPQGPPPEGFPPPDRNPPGA